MGVPLGWIGGWSHKATDAASLAESGRGQQLAAEGGPARGGEEGGELRRAETLNRLHFPQILPFPLLPQAGGEAASTALRARSPGLALPPETASGPPPKVLSSLSAFSCFFLFGGSSKRARQGRARLRQSWDHGPGAGNRGAGAVLSACSRVPGRRAALGVRRQRALSRPGAARRGAGGPMGRAHTCPPGSGA